MAKMLKRVVLMFAGIALALFLLACGEDPVSRQPTVDPAAASVVNVRKATPIAVPSSLVPTATLASTATAAAPTPTSTGMHNSLPKEPERYRPWLLWPRWRPGW